MRLLMLVAGVAVGSLAAAPAFAETYYVDPRGDNGGSGSSSQPWQSLQHAADRVGPGDIVMVRAGTHRGFDLRRSGTDGAPIRFLGEDGAIINLDNPETPDGINVEGVSWVEIEGFTVRGSTRAGIRAADCAAVTIKRNRVDSVGVWGIFSGFCDDLHVIDNVTSGARRQHGIYLSNSGDRPIVRGNEVFECQQSGIQLNGDRNEGGDGVITGALIEENRIHHTGAGGGAAINLDGVVDATIRGNVLWDNRANGISVFRIDGGAPSTGNRIVNNTIVMPEKTRWAVHLWDASTETTVVNNILLSDHATRGAIDIMEDSVRGLRSDHNALIGRFTLDDANTVIGLADWQKRTGQDKHSFVATAEELFTDWRTDDFSLKTGSPAIDKGDTTLTPRRDARGFARPIGVAVDIGAYEMCRKEECQRIDLPADPPRQGRHAGSTAGGGGGSGPGGTASPPGCCGGGGPAASVLPVLLVMGALGRRRPRAIVGP
jgi:hypothetical protein